MIRFGLIGCGNISKFHFSGIEKAGARVTYLVDVNEAAAEPWVKKTGAKFSKDYKDLICSEDVDVVSILASTRFHKEMAIAALRAGKDVVCEKTMTNNSEEAKEIVEVVKETGRMFYTTYMKRFFPAMGKGKELLPGLGRIISAQIRSYQCWGDFFTVKDLGWASGVTGNLGGAILKAAGSHMLDAVIYFLGRPDSVYCSMDYFPNTDFDRRATAIMEYEDGTAATFETIPHNLQRIGYEKNSWDEKIEINGTKGRMEIWTVMWDAPENNGALLRFYDNETQTSTEYRYAPVNPFDIEIKEIVKSVETRKQIHPDVIDGFNVDTLISAMKESAQKKARVMIDWKGV